ncbi:MAG: DNA-3-methyladenine glycosylase I [Acetobacter sp.]|nr:DNA-3-methyladenine glycosylase I [Acetobacter sp.]
MTVFTVQNSLSRCRWAEANAVIRDYHDTEWGHPVYESRQLWETLVLESFQCGLSWNVVLQKRDFLRRAFYGFDPHKVATMTPEDEARLVMDKNLIRSKQKIAAVIINARAWVTMHQQGEDFSDFVWSIASQSETYQTDTCLQQTPRSRFLTTALKKRGFVFIGPVMIYAWMQAIGMVNGHESCCFLRLS